MSAVVSDTSPINYLVRIGELELLPKLFGEVLIPPAVLGELQHPGAPPEVRQWALQPPSWAKIVAPVTIDQGLDLGPGEIEAIALAKELGDALVLIDDRKGRIAAQKDGLPTAGTLNILEEGSIRGLIDFNDAVGRLSKTNFRASNSVLTEFLQRARGRRN
jgi:predicted nucleic acid-binding protein